VRTTLDKRLLQEVAMRRYNKSVNNPEGIPEDPTRCIVEVTGKSTTYQCRRKRGYGPNKLFCKQHAATLSKGVNLCIPQNESELDTESTIVTSIRRHFKNLRDQINNISNIEDVYERAEFIRSVAIKTFEDCYDITKTQVVAINTNITKKLSELTPHFYSYLSASLKRGMTIDHILQKIKELEDRFVDIVKENTTKGGNNAI